MNTTGLDRAAVDPLTIVGVAELCAEVAARSTILFEHTGREVATARPGPLQRLWALASHRHAAHVEMADERVPTIPIVDRAHLVNQALAAARAEDRPGDIDDREFVAWWRHRVEVLFQTLDTADERTTEDLDPATKDLIERVKRDLEDLTRRVTEIASA